VRKQLAIGRCLPSLSPLTVVLHPFSQRSTCWTLAPFRAGHMRPISDSLQADIGFFQHPVPHPCGRSLRSACLRTMAATTGTTLASEEGREDRVPRVPEQSWPLRAQSHAAGRKDRVSPFPGKNTGFPRSTSEVLAGLGACYQPGGSTTARGCRSRPLPATFTFWFKPVSLFGLLSL